MPTNNGKYVLITGATSGFGYEFCKIFARDGYNLVMVARSHDRLQDICTQITKEFGVDAWPLAKNLFYPEAAKEIYDAVIQRGITVDVLVNDAGQGEHGFFIENELQRELDIIQLNINSLVALTKYFLKDMVVRNEGKILQVASVLAVYPTPLMAVYAGSKAFVLTFTESLINELKDTNVTMTALMPGASDTDFFHKAGAEHTYVYNETSLSDPAQVAKDGYEALMKGERKIVSGLKNKVQAAMTNLMPDNALAGMMRKQMEPSEETQSHAMEHKGSREEREMIEVKNPDNSTANRNEEQSSR